MIHLPISLLPPRGFKHHEGEDARSKRSNRVRSKRSDGKRWALHPNKLGKFTLLCTISLLALRLAVREMGLPPPPIPHQNPRLVPRTAH